MQLGLAILERLFYHFDHCCVRSLTWVVCVLSLADLVLFFFQPICSVKFCLPTASTVYSNYTLRFVPADNFVVWLWLGVDTETRQFKVSPQLGFQTQSSESQKAAISGPVFKVYAQRLELVSRLLY